jgi:hypothetical protein
MHANTTLRKVNRFSSSQLGCDDETAVMVGAAAITAASAAFTAASTA